jgi:hypothetical protein
MSRIQVDNILDKVGDGAPTFPNGLVSSGVVTATSFVGSGASLTGIDATSLKDGGGTIRVQANTSGVVVTGVATATSFKGDGSQLSGVGGDFDITSSLFL